MSMTADARALMIAVVTATLMIAQQVAGKATRDTLFLMHFDVTSLPGLVVAAAVVSFAGVLLMSALLARSGPMPLVPLAFAVSGMLFVVEWSLSSQLPGLIAIVLYLHMSLFGAVLISGFWSVVNERFDPRTAKASVARIAAAATLGGVIGGFVSSRVAAVLDLKVMLLVLGAMHAFCAIGVAGMGGREPGRAARRRGRAAGGMLAGIRIIRQTPFLLSMALLSACTALVSALLDYALKTEAAATLEGGPALVTFFGGYYAVVGVVTFLLQGLFGRIVVSRLGLSGSIATLPLAVMAGGGVALALPTLWTTTLLRGTESVLTNSYYRAGFELLYAPLRPDLKRPTKTIIDVASSRFGDFLGGGLLILVLALVPTPPASLIISLAMVFMVLALFATLQLHRGYVAELARSLRTVDGSVPAGDGPLLARTEPDNERAFLLSRINALQDVTLEDAEEREGERSYIACDAEAQALHDLRLGTAASVRQALANPGFSPLLAPALLPLLVHPEVGDEIRMELRWMAPRIVGLLTDALLDPDVDVAVRRQLPSIFEILHMPRAVDALVAGLTDNDFSVRYKCARVLGRMTGRNAELRARPDEVWEAVRRELSVPEEAWESQHPELSSTLTGRPAGDALELEELPPSLAHVYTLLLLVLDREAVALSVRALSGGDAVMRGTALEYLENVLPEDVRRALWRRLGVTADGVTRRHSRTREAVLDALSSSSDQPRPRGTT